MSKELKNWGKFEPVTKDDQTWYKEKNPDFKRTIIAWLDQKYAIAGEDKIVDKNPQAEIWWIKDVAKTIDLIWGKVSNFLVVMDLASLSSEQKKLLPSGDNCSHFDIKFAVMDIYKWGWVPYEALDELNSLIEIIKNSKQISGKVKVLINDTWYLKEENLTSYENLDIRTTG